MRQEKGETFLDAEELCYPSGSLRQSRRHFAARCPDGIIHRGICAIPDTFFSIPARIKVKGKTIAGYVSSNDEEFTFTPYLYRKNGHVLDA